MRVRARIGGWPPNDRNVIVDRSVKYGLHGRFYLMRRVRRLVWVGMTVQMVRSWAL